MLKMKDREGGVSSRGLGQLQGKERGTRKTVAPLRLQGCLCPKVSGWRVGLGERAGEGGKNSDLTALHPVSGRSVASQSNPVSECTASNRQGRTRSHVHLTLNATVSQLPCHKGEKWSFSSTVPWGCVQRFRGQGEAPGEPGG